MPISDIIRLRTGALTNQQLADMALEADREARRQRKLGGDLVRAAEAEQERDLLCRALT